MGGGGGVGEGNRAGGPAADVINELESSACIGAGGPLQKTLLQ